MDDSQMHYAKLQKPDVKGHILYDYISMTFWRKTKIGGRGNPYQCLAETRVWRECLIIKGHKGILWCDGRPSFMTVWMGLQWYAFIKSHRTIH